MARDYSKCDDVSDIPRERLNHLIEKYFPDLGECEVKVDLLFVTDKEGPPIIHRGQECHAMIRQLSQKDRSKGMGDVEILIDKEFWETLSFNRKDALLHHELYHLLIKRETESDTIVRDPLGRPRFRMRAHDLQVGWFREVAKIYGRDSIELVQAEKMMLEDGQLFWPQLTDKQGALPVDVPVNAEKK